MAVVTGHLPGETFHMDLAVLSTECSPGLMGNLELSSTLNSRTL